MTPPEVRLWLRLRQPGEGLPRGTLLSNYILPTTAFGNVGEIDPKALTASLTSTVDKICDGGLVALLTSGDYTLSGFITGQGATVTQTSGLYGSANVGSGIGVSATLASGNFTANSGTLLSNYILPTTAFGNVGEIDPRAITIAANNDTVAAGQPALALTYSLTNGSLVAGDTIAGALTRVSGETPGLYPILEGTLSLSANYTLTFIDGAYTITSTVTPTVVTTPANGSSSSAANSLAIAFEDPANQNSAATSFRTAGGYTPQINPQSTGSLSGEGAPYPDNVCVSSNIRFTTAGCR